MENLENVLESIFFAIGRPIKVKEICDTLSIKEEEVNGAIEKLINKYSGKSGISVVKVDNSYQMVTNKDNYEYVNKFVENSKKETLSTTCLEVLSIIAYNPKITKSEIENIRGINSDSQVSKLLEYGLIEEVGRLKLPGRPAAFSVTNEFLKSMGINSIEELPDFELFTDKEIQKEEVEIVEE